MKKTNLLHGFILIALLASGVLAFWYAKGQTMVQLIIGILISIGYMAWGIIHHTLKGDLHRKVVIEYILVGLIAIILLITLAV